MGAVVVMGAVADALSVGFMLQPSNVWLRFAQRTFA